MCDTVVTVGADGVLFAKNSDRDPNEAQALEWHPAARHDPGARLRCTWIEIEQAPNTHAVLLSRPFWMWGAEIGANEHGVTIGNEAVFTREPYAATGLTGMDLLRLALERATSAAAAVDVIVHLLERHGQGGSCGLERPGFTYHNSFAVADPGDAFILETAGREWAVEAVRGGTRSISNGLTIDGFAERYGTRLRSRVASCRARRAVTAGADPSPGGLIATMRSHGEHRWPSYSAVNGAMSGPCVHAGGRLALTQTTAAWVADLRDGRGLHWVTGTAAPCVSLFKPARVSDPLNLGPLPTDSFDPQALWWRGELLHRRAMRSPESAQFVTERDEVEREWLTDQPTPAEAFARGDELLSRWASELPEDVHDVRPAFVRRLWRERDRRAGVPALGAPLSAQVSMTDR